jgi:hypothetical protein
VKIIVKNQATTHFLGKGNDQENADEFYYWPVKQHGIAKVYKKFCNSDVFLSQQKHKVHLNF